MAASGGERKDLSCLSSQIEAQFTPDSGVKLTLRESEGRT
jgi:hypothetical protein